MMSARCMRAFGAIAALLVVSCFDTLYDAPYSLERQRVDRDNHDARFPINRGAHQGSDCDDCHGAFETFTRFSCVDCHEHGCTQTDATHSGLDGYRCDSAACYTCHPTGETMTREQHEPFFPISTGKHGGFACRLCHVGGFGSVSCIECHEHRCSETDQKHREVSGYSCQSMACLQCHPRGVAEDDD